MPDDLDVELAAEAVFASLRTTPAVVVRALGAGLSLAAQPGVSALGHALEDVPDGGGPDFVNRLRLQVALKMLALDDGGLRELTADAVGPPWVGLRAALDELAG